MRITKQTVADQIAACLHHRLTLAQLVDWAENALLDAEFPPEDMEALRFVLPRLGLADVRAFGLTWEDCEQMLQRLGYRVRVELIA